MFIFMFENVDWFHGHFLQYVVFKVLVDRVATAKKNAKLADGGAKMVIPDRSRELCQICIILFITFSLC